MVYVVNGGISGIANSKVISVSAEGSNGAADVSDGAGLEELDIGHSVPDRVDALKIEVSRFAVIGTSDALDVGLTFPIPGEHHGTVPTDQAIGIGGDRIITIYI